MIENSARYREAMKRKGWVLSPSILSADPLALAGSVDKLQGEEDWLHVDIMDGHFVPNLTFGPSTLKALKKKYPDKIMDVHIMAEPAEQFVEMFLGAGADILTVHCESARHLHRSIDLIKQGGAAAGVAIDPGTPLSMVEPVLHDADLVLVMSVDPGFGGQKFISESFTRIKELFRMRTARNGSYMIECDGGIGADNVADVIGQGCDAVVCGSAVFGAVDPMVAAREIKKRGDQAVAVRLQIGQRDHG